MIKSKVSLHSEQYGRTGNIGENFRKLLGAPSLDPLQTLVREAVQNIADAAKLGVGPEVLIRVRRLSASQMDFLRERFFVDLPATSSSRNSLQKFLSKENPIVIDICDFGTTGLAGPTRADRIPVGTTHTDFIDFIRNIGTPRDTQHGGGTYGFGKVALYNMSQCSTIIVDSQVADGEEGSRRLIGCHVGKSYDLERDGFLHRYTGRHWWGSINSEEDYAEPALDLEAQELSEALGLPMRSGSKSGTSIMILDVETAGESESGAQAHDIAGQLCEAVLWNFWPRLMEDAAPSKKFAFKMEVDGVDLEVPKVENFSPLNIFAQAMRKARTRQPSEDVDLIESLRPKKELGWFSHARGQRVTRTPLTSSQSIIPKNIHHVALMRPVELVVKYVEGAPFDNDDYEWGAVFLVSSEDDVERAFAESEPPAHDDWVPENLPKGPQKTYVSVALREISNKAATLVRPVDPSLFALSSSDYSLAGISQVFGAYVNLKRQSVRVNSSSQRAAPKRKTRKNPQLRTIIRKPEFVGLDEVSGGVVALFDLEVIPGSRPQAELIRLNPLYAADGKAIEVGDLLSPPAILEVSSNGVVEQVDSEGRVSVTPSESKYRIRVSFSPEAAVTLKATLESK